MDLPPLVTGRLIRRYKRFLADVELDTGEVITAHCANPGSMMGLQAPGIPVWLSVSDDPKRKLKHSWKLAKVDFGWCGPQLVSIDTGHPNTLAEEAIRAGRIAALAGYGSVRREVRYGRNSRIDLLLTGSDDTASQRPDCYVEVKNVHLMRQPGLAEFPDSVTSRGAKHLEELGDMVEAGHRAVMLFVVQMAAERFAIAGDIDPAYATALERARARGVEVLVHVCTMATDRIVLAGPIPFRDEGPSALRQGR
ncbi:MAG: DNA/RNA nuclease SfsA [Beijerinckiaceae bacterium]|nr:DNA/RNA nuclease SfsA [Beijerinckiaceae bacterium]